MVLGFSLLLQVSPCCQLVVVELRAAKGLVVAAWCWDKEDQVCRYRHNNLDILTLSCISCAGEWLRPPGAGGGAAGDQPPHRAGGRGQVRQPRQAEAARVNTGDTLHTSFRTYHHLIHILDR